MKKILLLMIMMAAIQSQGFASISVDESTSPAVLRNNGYSADLADSVNVSKSRARGQEYYTQDEINYRSMNKFTKFWRKFYVYADPAAEDYSFYHHDIKTTPHYSDL